MRMQLSTLVKIVLGSALLMGFFRVTGFFGFAAVSVGAFLIVLPALLMRWGRQLGESILSGFLGGGIGFSAWVLVWSGVAPVRLGASSLYILLPIGMIYGGLFGLIVSSGDILVGRPRPRSRGLAYRYDLVLLIVLVAIVACALVVDEFRWAIIPVRFPRLAHPKA